MDARTNTTFTMLKAALSYAARGWYVFPAHGSGEKKSHKSAKFTPSGLPWGMSVDADEIRADFAKFSGCNVSIVTGEVSGIFVVECDTQVGHNVDGAANLTEWERVHGALPDTLMAESPTGSVHRYFKHPGKKVWNSNNTIAPGVDCKGDGGMVVAPPSVRPNKPGKPGGIYRWVNEGHDVAEAPQALLDAVCGPKKKPNDAHDGENEWTHFGKTYGAWSEGSGNGKWYAFNTAILKNLSAWFPALFPGGAQPYQDGYTVSSEFLKRNLQERISALPIGIYDFGLERGYTPIDLVIEYNQTDFREAIAWLSEKTGITIEDDNEEVASVALDDFYAFMPSHSYIFVPTREMWPTASVNSRVPPVKVLKNDGTPLKDKNGNDRRVKANIWLDAHRAVEQMTWAPGLPLTIANRLISEGGWIERNGVTTFNLYRPAIINQSNSTGADRWIELVHRVYPEDANQIITFCAHRVQYPEIKINHGLILGGAPGIGKDTMLEPLKYGVGPWNFKEVSPQDIMGTYNDFMRCVVLRVSEAHDLGEVNRYAFYDHMKTMLATPPDVVRVNGKYIPQHYILNVAGVIYTTNHRFDGVYLPADDRRTYVAWSEIKQADFTSGFWPSLWDWYKSGGLENVVANLSELDISRFDPKAPPKKTDAFWQIVGAGAAPEESDLADILDELGNAESAMNSEGKPCGPAVTTLAKVLAAANGTFFEWLNERKNRRVVPHKFERCGYAPVRNGDAKDGLWVIGGKRQVVYGRSDLPLRDRIMAAAKL